jgi:hypothetical protein
MVRSDTVGDIGPCRQKKTLQLLPFYMMEQVLVIFQDNGNSIP